MDKRAKAQIHLENALRELNLALSTLGGKTRSKPKIFPPPYRFIARQYLESIIVRLRVTTAILAQRKQDDQLSILALKSRNLSDDSFRAMYESTREEHC